MSHGVFVGFVPAEGEIVFQKVLDFPSAFKAYLAKFRGDEIEVEVHKKGAKKTREQEAGFHAMIAPWCRDEGHEIGDLKRYLLGEIFGYREEVSKLTKLPLLVKPHTSKLNKAEYSELIERTMEIAAWAGYVLIAPDEYRRLHPEKYPPKKAANRSRTRAA